MDAFSHTATLLSNGKVPIEGSHYDGPIVDYGELFDPGANAFNATGTTDLLLYGMHPIQRPCFKTA